MFALKWYFVHILKKEWRNVKVRGLVISDLPLVKTKEYLCLM